MAGIRTRGELAADVFRMPQRLQLPWQRVGVSDQQHGLPAMILAKPLHEFLGIAFQKHRQFRIEFARERFRCFIRRTKSVP